MTRDQVRLLVGIAFFGVLHHMDHVLLQTWRSGISTSASDPGLPNMLGLATPALGIVAWAAVVAGAGAEVVVQLAAFPSIPSCVCLLRPAFPWTTSAMKKRRGRPADCPQLHVPVTRERLVPTDDPA